MPQSFSRKTLEDQINIGIQADKKIRALWYGGSRATKTEDALSDLDIVMICTDPIYAFDLFKSIVNKVHSIEKVWSVEASLWKHFNQKFYILENTPSSFYLDVGVFTSLNPDDYQEFFNTARHGSPQIIFDRDQILQKASLHPKLEKKSFANIENELARFEIMYRTFLKEYNRGKYIDAYTFYQRLVIWVVQYLRATKTPQRHDFAFRYIATDLDQTNAHWIEYLLKTADLESLKAKADEIKIWVEQKVVIY